MKTAIAALMCSTILGGVANASPIPVAWNPLAAGLGGEMFTQNDQIISDYSLITINSKTGQFTDQGILPIVQFLNGNSPVSGTGLNTSYSLYYDYTASGYFTHNGVTGLSTTGNNVANFLSLSYQLMGDSSPNLSVGFTSATSAPVSNATSGTVLAKGGLSNDGGSTGSYTLGGAPSAQVVADFQPTDSAFFVNPASTGYNNLVLDAAFTNTNSVLTLTTPTASDDNYYLQINGGGGNADFNVPEPSTVLMIASAVVLLIAGRSFLKSAN